MYEVFEQLIQQKGITPYRVAKDTGVTQTALSNWKTGRSIPSTPTLQKIADYFGVTIDYLMTGKDDEPKENQDDVYYLDPETAKAAQEMLENEELHALFDVQRDMPPEDLRAMYNMALALKRKERGNEDDTGC